jgi:pilus assembly protein Flp/PilA
VAWPSPIVQESRGPAVIIRFLSKLRRSAKGATAVEYGLILALIVIVAMVAIMTLADTTIGMWDDIAENVLAH